MMQCVVITNRISWGEGIKLAFINLYTMPGLLMLNQFFSASTLLIFGLGNSMLADLCNVGYLPVSLTSTR